MRFLLYNIRYATGTGAAFHLPVPGAGYLRSNSRVLSGITRFIKDQDPDIVGLVEVDTGSIRTGRVNQAQVIGESLGHYSTYQCKYGADSLNTLIDDLVRPTTEISRTIGAVAKGDLGQSMELEVDGRPLKGEFLRSAKLVNSMIEQLAVFTSEVTRVAREVGTEGKLGGQAQEISP